MSVLFLDIETSPNVVYSWRTGYKLRISEANIIEERRVICVCYKYEGKAKVHHLDWGKKRDDRQLLNKFAEVLNTCDVAIAHNGDRFDLKWLKGRALLQGTTPITNIRTIDTLKLARSNFALNSNKLDYLAKLVSKDQKLKVYFELWKRVMAGDKQSLNKMVQYCKKDVVLLEKVYHKLLPYVDKLPVHMGLIKGSATRDSCPKCGSMFGQKYGLYYSPSGKYQKYRCDKGHVYKGRRAIL